MDLLSIEVALLIASGISKGINVSLWLSDGWVNNIVPSTSFIDKLKSLSLVVGVHADNDTKTELEKAISEDSINVIINLCNCGKDTNGIILINVVNFLKICQARIDKYLTEMSNDGDDDDDDDDHDDEIYTENDEDNEEEDSDDDNNSNHSQEKGNSEEDYVQVNYNEYSDDDVDDDDYNDENPEFFPHGLNSPFDEEVAFGDEDDIETQDTSEILEKSKNLIASTDDSRLQNKSTSCNNNSGGNSPLSKGSNQKAYKHQITGEVVRSNNSSPVGMSSLPIRLSTSYNSSNSNNNKLSNDNKKKGVTNNKNYMKSRKTLNYNLKFSQIQPSFPSAIIKENRISLSNGLEDILSKMKRFAFPDEEDDDFCDIEINDKNPNIKKQISNLYTMTNIPINSHKQYSGYVHIVNPEVINLKSFSDIEIVEKKLEVEDNIRNVIKHKESYRLIFINFGFISSSGGNILSKQGINKPWLSIRDLQRGFLIGSKPVRLTGIEAYILMKLVKDYSKNSKINEEEDKVNKDKLINKSKIIILTGNKVNSSWFEKYLKQLRLSKTSTLTSINNISKLTLPSRTDLKKNGERTTNENIASVTCNLSVLQDTKNSNQKKNRKKKSSNKKSGNDYMTKIYNKVTSGKPHLYSKKDVNIMLLNNSKKIGSNKLLLSSTNLLDEIARNVYEWTVDMDGKKDFIHKLNIEYRLWKNNNSSSFFTSETGENDNNHIDSIIESLKSKLIDEKTNELLTQERTHGLLTKELFWKYDRYLRDSDYSINTSWSEWLCQYLNKSASKIDKYNQSLSKTTKASSLIRDIKGSSPIKSVKTTEDAIKESLVVDSLREKLLSISKENSLDDFDVHLRKIMVPYLKSASNENQWNPDTDIRKSPVKSLTKNLLSQSSASSKKKLETEKELFTKSLNDIEKKIKKEIIDDFDKINNTGGKKYKDWKQSKDELIKSKSLKLIEKEKLKIESDKLKFIENFKSYKRWKQLLKSHKYISSVSGEIKKIPNIKIADHDTKWRYSINTNVKRIVPSSTQSTPDTSICVTTAASATITKMNFQNVLETIVIPSPSSEKV